MAIKTESDLKKLVSMGNKFAIGRVKLFDSDAVLIGCDDESATIIEKYREDGYKICNYKISEKNKKLFPANEKILDCCHAEYDMAKFLYSQYIPGKINPFID